MVDEVDGAAEVVAAHRTATTAAEILGLTGDRGGRGDNTRKRRAAGAAGSTSRRSRRARASEIPDAETMVGRDAKVVKFANAAEQKHVERFLSAALKQRKVVTKYKGKMGAPLASVTEQRQNVTDAVLEWDAQRRRAEVAAGRASSTTQVKEAVLRISDATAKAIAANAADVDGAPVIPVRPLIRITRGKNVTTSRALDGELLEEALRKVTPDIVDAAGDYAKSAKESLKRQRRAAARKAGAGGGAVNDPTPSEVVSRAVKTLTGKQLTLARSTKADVIDFIDDPPKGLLDSIVDIEPETPIAVQLSGWLGARRAAEKQRAEKQSELIPTETRMGTAGPEVMRLYDRDGVTRQLFNPRIGQETVPVYIVKHTPSMTKPTLNVTWMKDTVEDILNDKPEVANALLQFMTRGASEDGEDGGVTAKQFDVAVRALRLEYEARMREFLSHKVAPKNPEPYMRIEMAKSNGTRVAQDADGTTEDAAPWRKALPSVLM